MRVAFTFWILGMLCGYGTDPSWAGGADTIAQCTPKPALVEDWKGLVKKEMVNTSASEEEIATYVSSIRGSRVQSLSQRFEEIAGWDDPTWAKQKKERFLWKNARIMVLVDANQPPPYTLVVARTKGVWLLTDADPSLVDELATVAAAAADSAMAALNLPCNPQFAKIHIHPPKGLGMRQLHIHVEPQVGTARTLTTQQLADRMTDDLKVRLARD
jgi:diadenosine tetraphosphate (Ap4A) HIT family hydrolase